MSSTSSTAHRRDFCRALYLQPSPEKLGRAARNGCVCFACSKRQLLKVMGFYELLWVSMGFYGLLCEFYTHIVLCGKKLTHKY